MRRAAREALTWAAYSRRGAHSHGTVLIVGHMRAGTSVTAHLLCSNPRITGWGERNRPITGPHDLARLAADVAWRSRDPRIVLPPPIGPRWVLDVLNHDHLAPQHGVFRRRGVRTLLVLRRPEPTLASMHAYLGRHYGWSALRCAQYLLVRLRTMTSIARSVRADGDDAGRLVRFEDLETEPSAALAPLGPWLEIRGTWDGGYLRQTWTGEFGDRSPSIFAGRVLGARERGADARQLPEIPDDLWSALREAHAACEAVMGRGP